MLDTFESPLDGLGEGDAGDARMENASKEGYAAASPTGSDDPEDEIVDDDLDEDDLDDDDDLDLDDDDDDDDDLDEDEDEWMMSTTRMMSSGTTAVRVGAGSRIST